MQALGAAAGPTGAAAQQEAVARLEQLASSLSDWPALVASLRDRAAAASGTADELGLRMSLATAEEERLADLDAAALSFGRALELAPAGSGERAAAIRALVRLHDARADWAALAAALELELADAPDDGRAALLVRLGALEERNLERPAAALPQLSRGVRAARRGGGAWPRRRRAGPVPTPFAALDACPAVRRARRRRTRPSSSPRCCCRVTRRGATPGGVARCLEAGRTAAAPAEAIEHDRRLLAIYGKGVVDPARAWATRAALAAAPGDVEAHRALDRLAGQLGRDGELARRSARRWPRCEAAGAPAAEVRGLAAERARVLGRRLGDAAAAERAWAVVLESSTPPTTRPTPRCRRRCARAAWPELRAARASRRGHPRRRRSSRPRSSSWPPSRPDRRVRRRRRAGRHAIAAHRRVLDVDPEHEPSRQALEAAAARRRRPVA
ncbi:MAG: hypothetical protein R2939_14115 [Kofleriaceae bacterium]